jgi:hypothetical protein
MWHSGAWAAGGRVGRDGGGEGKRRDLRRAHAPLLSQSSSLDWRVGGALLLVLELVFRLILSSDLRLALVRSKLVYVQAAILPLPCVLRNPK